MATKYRRARDLRENTFRRGTDARIAALMAMIKDRVPPDVAGPFSLGPDIWDQVRSDWLQVAPHLRRRL